MDIKQLITEKVTAVLDEKLEQIVTKNIESAIQSIFTDTFRSYGSGNKILTEIIEQSMGIALKMVKIDSYQDRVVKIVEDELGNYLSKEAGAIFQARIKGTCQILEKTTWNFSEILEVFVKGSFPDDEEYFEPTVEVEKTNYNSTHIYISEYKNKNKYSCEYQLFLNKEGKVWSFDADGKMTGGRQKSLHGPFEQLLFALYANQATVIIDEYETEFYKESY